MEALAIYRRSEDTGTLDLANATRSYAVLQDKVGAVGAAKQLWQETHDLYVVVHVSAGVAESAARLAKLAARDGDSARSRDWINEASAAAAVANDPETLLYVCEVKEQIERDTAV